MGSNDLRSEWQQMKREAKSRWDRLTDDDLDTIEGDADRLVRRLQERYGFPRQIVLAEVGHFLSHRH